MSTIIWVASISPVTVYCSVTHTVGSQLKATHMDLHYLHPHGRGSQLGKERSGPRAGPCRPGKATGDLCLLPTEGNWDKGKTSQWGGG